MNKILKYRQSNSIRLKCEINLDNLFESPTEKSRFNSKWCQFLASDPRNAEIFHLKGNRLCYDSEQLIPTKTDKRPPLLLVLGNPASQSIKNRMFFSFQSNGNEHRFWKSILKNAEILRFNYDIRLPYDILNMQRKKQLLNLNYDSPFRIGLCVFITMPSAPGGTWGGVAGVQKLIGVRALKKLEQEETNRILKLAKKFVNSKGAAIAFQKNAWKNLHSEKDPAYHIEDARKGKLRGKLKKAPHILFFGVPPTRLSGPCGKVLKQIASKLK